MRKPAIAVIDYGMGNIRSVSKALALLGAKPVISSSAAVIDKCDAVVFPGVGSYGAAIDNLKKRKLFDYLQTLLLTKKPFLGLCLGFQLLFKTSEESKNYNGLSILDGKVVKFKARKLKIPHMGWNRVSFTKNLSNSMMKGIKNGSFFYFVHSYYCVPKKTAASAAFSDYGIDFCSALVKDNIWACQFHPEKSGELGLKLLKNFISFVTYAGNYSRRGPL